MPNSTCGVFTLRVNILLKLFLQEICITEMRFFFGSLYSEEFNEFNDYKRV
jgi:hypothetical protein